MKYWTLDTDGFHLGEPLEYRSWINYLGNGEYGLRLGHLGDGFATTLAEPRKVITNYDFFAPLKGRFVYVKSTPASGPGPAGQAAGPGGDAPGQLPVSAGSSPGGLIAPVPAPTLWNPSFYPTKARLDRYGCHHGAGFTAFDSEKDGVRVVSTHFLPRRGCFEIWRLAVTNTGPVARTVSLFPLVEFLLYDSFGVDPIYYSWYTNTRLEADGRTIAVFKTDASVVYGFLHSLENPQAWEGSLSRLRGNGDLREPAGLHESRLSGVPSAGDPYIGCFQFEITLRPGECWDNALFLGEGEAVRADVQARFASVAAVDAELAAVKADWKRRLHHPAFDRLDMATSSAPAGSPGPAADAGPSSAVAGTGPGTPSPAGHPTMPGAYATPSVPALATPALAQPELKAWLTGFFPYQIFQQSTGLVRSTWRGYRDVAQDAIGMSYFDLSISRRLILDLLDKQHPDGRCLRQWNTAGSYHDERDFRDLPLWLPLALDKYLGNGGDPDILAESRPWLKGSEPVSLWEHLIRGLEYSLRFGPHDLLLMGAGDWNDALSGLGPEGESLWLNQAAYLALDKAQSILDSHGARFKLECRLDIPALRERLYQGVIKGWTGQWFQRGWHQNGTPIGGPERIFLLPQAWFTISGMASRDPTKARIALDSMVARLDNPAGLLKCHPAFDRFDPVYGNLSALAPGMAENFAVYNHAAAFAIYALFQAGRDTEAWHYLERLVPVGKDPAQTRAEPYVLVNFYNGGYYPEKAGQGGIPWLTGTVNWFAMIFFDQLAGRTGRNP